ncbi:MAG: hypothetical protein FJ304_27950 [Planctomycetes bacterium]|nr:hypothetical protein [Planctomycetota bacterium]
MKVNRPPEPNAPWANVGETVATLCRRAESLCRRVAPRDLAGVPVYVVPQSAALGLFGHAKECDGFTVPSLDLYVRHAIGPAWRGRGPCMVVNDIALVADVPEDLEPYFLATAIHELAHILERPELYSGRSEPEPARLTFEALVIARAVAEPPTDVTEAAEFLTHDERFIRAALHLCHRAARVGEPVPLSLVWNHRCYGMSHVRAYRAALDDEPRRMADARIRDVLATPPPEPFARLWADDLDHHNREETTP